MKLPAHPKGGVQVGISDILQWRDCAARMQFGMRRHEGGDPPESWSPENAYGSAVHLCLSLLDDGATPQEAAARAITTTEFKRWLEPSDQSRLIEDMERYLEREAVGVRTLLNEGEISIPLFTHPTVGQVWFRARIDRLYQDLQDPGHLIHIDFKSSKWAKSRQEVDEDPQLWSYNHGIVAWFLEEYPEVEAGDVRLEQIYDQLRYGEIPTSKSAEQREEIRLWLIAQITAIIEDEAAEPTFNQWCPWCPLKMDCPVVQDELTDWALTKIATLMPREERLNKDGSVSKKLGAITLDEHRIAEYAKLLPEIKRGRQVLEAFEDELGETMKRMTEADLADLGKIRIERSKRTFSTEAKRRISEEIGLGAFLMICELSLSGVERFFQSEPERGKEIAALAEKRPGATLIVDA